jgi:hypothetical protein
MRRTALLPFLLACAACASQYAQEPPPASAEAAPVVRVLSRGGRTPTPSPPRPASPGSALEAAAEPRADGARADRWPQVEVGAGYTRRSEVPELAIFTPTDDRRSPSSAWSSSRTSRTTGGCGPAS